MTSKSPYKRALELSTTGLPKPFQVVDFWKVDSSELSRIEKDIHKSLESKRDSSNREFFRLTPEGARSFVEEFLEQRSQVEDLRKEAAKTEEIRRKENKEIADKKRELTNILISHMSGVSRKIYESLSKKYEKAELFDLYDKFRLKEKIPVVKKRGNAWWSVRFNKRNRPEIIVPVCQPQAIQ